MALFESRRVAEKRVSDRLSQTDKAVWLESVRRRRQHQADKAALLAALHGLRSNR